MKAILVGLGGRAKCWFKECTAHPEVEIAAYVEPFAPNKERAVKEWGVAADKIHDDLNTAVKKVKADFVVDVTPPAIHEKIALTAFENGLHLLGEKPLSDNFGAAKRVVEAGKKAGVKHMITQNYRFNGLPRTTRRMIEGGAIGQVGQLSVTLYVAWADNPGSHYVTQPFMFLTDMGVHHFDMMRYTLGADCESVQALTWNLPWGWHKGDACQAIVFRFKNGMVATHHGVGCTMGHMPAGHNGEWRFDGSKGTLSWEGSDLWLTRQHKADPKVREKQILDTTENTQGTAALLREFVSALKENRPPECNAEDNLKSMSMVFGAVKSAQERREVKLSEL